MSAFSDLGAIPAQQLAPGYTARAVHGGRLTLAVVEIEPNAELPEHSHENEQLGLVLRGSVRFRVGAEEQTLAAGGMWCIPPNTPHLVRGGPDGAVVADVFAPAREEWGALEELPPADPSWP
jgi:quercetin dioxygenase-like cupin family protein